MLQWIHGFHMTWPLSTFPSEVSVTSEELASHVDVLRLVTRYSLEGTRDKATAVTTGSPSFLYELTKGTQYGTEFYGCTVDPL